MQFTLDIFDANEEQIISTLRGLNKKASYLLTEYGSADEDDNWIERVEELKSFSLNYPGVLFQLTVYEIEFDHHPFREYYKDGKMQTAFGQLVYPSCTL